MAPKPVQKPHPALWVGGESEPALRRVARLGDGWYPIGTNPKHPLDTLSAFRARIDRMQHLVREAGRDPSQVAIAYRVARYGSAVPGRNEQGARRLFSGTPADIAGDLRAFGDLGVTAVDFGFSDQTVDLTLGNMKRFRSEVLANL